VFNNFLNNNYFGDVIPPLSTDKKLMQAKFSKESVEKEVLLLNGPDSY